MELGGPHGRLAQGLRRESKPIPQRRTVEVEARLERFVSTVEGSNALDAQALIDSMCAPVPRRLRTARPRGPARPSTARGNSWPYTYTRVRLRPHDADSASDWAIRTRDEAVCHRRCQPFVGASAGIHRRVGALGPVPAFHPTSTHGVSRGWSTEHSMESICAHSSRSRSFSFSASPS